MKNNAVSLLLDSSKISSLSTKEKQLLDSCIRVFLSEKDDTTRLDALIYAYKKISFVGAMKNTKLICHKIDQSIKKSNNKEYRVRLNERKARVTLLEGHYYYNSGKFQQALQCCFKSYKEFKKVNSSKGLIESALLLSRIYIKQGKIIKAHEYLNKVKKIGKERNFHGLTIESLNLLGVLFEQQDDYTKALEYYHQALELVHRVNRKSAIPAILSNIGVVYGYLGKRSKSLKYHRLSYKFSIITGNRVGLLYNRFNIGTCYLEMSRLDSADKYYSSLLKELETVNNKYLFSSILYQKGVICLEKGDSLQAFSHLIRAHELARKKNFPRVVINTSKCLSRLYESQGNMVLALNMYKLHTLLRDSLDATDRLQKIEREKNREKIISKREEIKGLKKDKQLQGLRLKYSLLIYLLILLGVIMVAIFWSIRRRRKFEAELARLRAFDNELKTKQTKEKVDSLPISIGKKVMLIKLDDVIYFKTEGRYVFLTNKEGKSFIVDQTMTSLEDLLPKTFFRIHRGVIISIEAIQEYERTTKGRVVFTVKSRESTKFRSTPGYASNVKEITKRFSKGKD